MGIRKVVIPVAGSGTRLLPVTKSQPKEMLPIGRKPVVQYVVEESLQAGLKQVLFVTGRQKTCIEDHFDRDVDLIRKLSESGKSELLRELAYTEADASFFYVRQSAPAGLADAVLRARDFAGDEGFVVSLGDTIIECDPASKLLRRMLDAHEKTKAACTIAVEEVPLEEVPRYGIVKPKEGSEGVKDVFEISDLLEKPSPAGAPSRFAIAARYVLTPAIFEAIERTVPDESGELQLTDSIRVLINQGALVQCVLMRPDENRYDIGNFESFFRTFTHFAMKDEKYGYTLRQYLHHLLME